MLDKPLNSLTAEDIQSLISCAARENRTLDFKLKLPGKSDSDHKGFLADASSFANAAGGDLVFGIKEDSGVAVEAVGINGLEEDSVRLRLESILRDGISPRIPGVAFRTIEGFLEGPVLICRVPRSWAGW